MPKKKTTNASAPYRELKAHNMRRYVELAGDASGWIFRGQRKSSWSLETSLERWTRDMPLLEAEGRVLYLFNRRAHQFRSRFDLPEDNDILGWLALLQHHGAPTRLLDWTTSPFVALYFALEGVEKDQTEPSAVWAIERQWLHQCAAKSLEAKAGSENAKKIALLAGSHSESFKSWIVDEGPQLVLPVDPYRQHDRVSSQQAVFLAPGSLTVSFETNLFADADQPRKHIFKIEVPTTGRARMLQYLRDVLNISHATLFPGLDGLASSLRHSVMELKDWNHHVLVDLLMGKSLNALAADSADSDDADAPSSTV
jgi:hypothetical protein